MQAEAEGQDGRARQHPDAATTPARLGAIAQCADEERAQGAPTIAEQQNTPSLLWREARDTGEEEEKEDHQDIASHGGAEIPSPVGKLCGEMQASGGRSLAGHSGIPC
ncbi:MAG: hypothetical protein HC838_15075 [Spirulinaceae cyanobacterium RM2_2_10]|nr:hypothetical protein [Spirulinaceae cyanobacterium RM2_2_10]